MSWTAREIAGLDPVRDHERIGFLLAAHEFPRDIEAGLQIALFRTYASPRISGLLARTGAFRDDARKRIDDTEILIAEIGENGQDSARGLAAIERMNAMHGRYRIPNEDMVYTLCAMIVEPARWIARHGKRPLSDAEQRAGLEFYRRLGARMGVTGIPGTVAACATFQASYEARHFAYAESNHEIGTLTRETFLADLPRLLRPLARHAAHALMDPPLRAAMGFPDAPRLVSRPLFAALALRRHLLRLLPVSRRPRLVTTRPRASYPGGYTIAALGTFPAAPRNGTPPTENAPAMGPGR